MRINTVLNRRRPQEGGSTQVDGSRSLGQLSVGDQGTVSGLKPGIEPRLARRLIDLGFGTGTRVEVVRRAPLGDPCIYRVCGYEIALRSEQTRLITIQPDA